MPTYTMNCFLLPKRVCSELQGIIHQVWWGQRGGERKINWLAWKKICVLKFHGGWGLEIWRLLISLYWLSRVGGLSMSLNLCLQRFLRKIFSECFFLAGCSETGMFICMEEYCSFSYCYSLIEHGLKWRIGNGSSISIRHDRWLPDKDNGKIHHPIEAIHSEAMVADLVDSDRGVWNGELVCRCFSPSDAFCILYIHLYLRILLSGGVFHPENSLLKVPIAAFATSHVYSGVESSDSMGMKYFWKAVWSMKLQNFIWRLCLNILPTRDNLVKRNIYTPIGCPICGYGSESPSHIFGQCIYAGKVWEGTDLGIYIPFLIWVLGYWIGFGGFGNLRESWHYRKQRWLLGIYGMFEMQQFFRTELRYPQRCSLMPCYIFRILMRRR